MGDHTQRPPVSSSIPLYRSEPMVYARLLMTGESAHDTIRALGNFGKFHFVDVGSQDGGLSEQFMYYKKRVAACQFWEKKLEGFKDAMEEHGITPPKGDGAELQEIKGDVIAGVKAFVEGIDHELDQHIDYKKQFETLINEQRERRHVLKICQKKAPFKREEKKEIQSGTRYGTTDERREGGGDVELKKRKGSSEELKKPLIDGEDESKVNSLSGVIPAARQQMFERMLFRVTRGNVIATMYEIQTPVIDPATGEEMRKSVFQLIFFGNKFYRRISKICQFFGATIYTIPSDTNEFETHLSEVDRTISEYESVLKKTSEEIVIMLKDVAWKNNSAVSPLLNWLHGVKQERMVCDTLKKCDTSRQKMITAEGWIPYENKEDLQDVLRQSAHSQSEQAVLDFCDPPGGGSPPTYFKLNKFTSSFQVIVDTYGVPRYQEANPGLFTIITFPFLYGIMYGDIGHSSLQVVFALYLIWHEQKYLKQVKDKTIGEIFGMLFGGRYLILMMALFALYAGWVYNDCFSIPFHLFHSHWTFTDDSDFATWNKDGVYPFGVDPSWYHTTNELTFFNSLKMKLSVTLGVIQMLFGITLGLSNDIFWGDWITVAFEFIPRFLFLFCTFGYMVIIIIYKWCQDYDTYPPGTDPPNLVQTMIAMFLSPGKVDADKQLYDGQAGVQAFLLVVALISVPLMLFPGPLITNWKIQKEAASHQHIAEDESEEEELAHAEEGEGLGHDEKESGFEAKGAVHKKKKKKAPHGGHGGGGHGHGGGDYSLSDHLITQSIHTIEFVLGAVSNTASYLRLWALSLAHSQLASVFWDKMIMQYGIESGSAFMVFVGFAVWAGATFGVLLAMDSLECFLHALRLHWVEFQNKFYHADGYPFRPFSFATMDEEGEE